jgi:hypothetical protein
MIRPSDWWMLDLQPPPARLKGAARPQTRREPAAANAPTLLWPRPHRENSMPRRDSALAARLLVNLIGGGVFVALLVASHQIAALATPLRAAAMLWFAGLVVVKLAVWRSMDAEQGRFQRRDRPLKRPFR